MKKVLSLATIMIMLAIVLTGCVNVNYEVTLNEDGTADIAYVYGFEKEFLEEMETTAEDMTSDMKESAEASEYEIELYSDDKIEGFKAKKHVEDLANMSLEEAFGAGYVTDSEENQLKVEKNGSKTVYSQNAKIDLTSMDSSMTSMVTMKYTVNLPVKAGENNASEVSKDGKTLTWNLKAGTVNEINFKASDSGTMLTIVIIVVVLVIICIIIAIIILTKKSKKENDKIENTNFEMDDKNEEQKETEVKSKEIFEEVVKEKNEIKENDEKEDK